MRLGDEMAKGVRPNHLFWADRGSHWTVMSGIDDPGVAIEIARSIACR